MDVFKLHYDSVGDLVVACEKAWNRGEKINWLGGRDREDFVGRKFNSFEEVKTAYHQPWEDGLAIIQGMIYEIDREAYNLPQPKTRRRRAKFDEYDGDDVDYDRLREGQPFWRKCVKQSLTGPQFVTLISATAASGGTSHEDILWRGAVGICLTDLLEKAGYRVRYLIAQSSTNVFPSRKYERFLLSAVVKEEQDTMDISNLTNSISGWFYRTIVGFQSKFIRGIAVDTCGYGEPYQISERDEEIQKLVGDGSLPIVIDGVWSKEQALAKVRSVIQKVNNTEIVA